MSKTGGGALGADTSEHHTHHRRRGRASAFLRSYLVEIIAAIVVALGIFLLLDRSLRVKAMEWGMAALHGVLRLLGYLGSAASDALSGLSPSSVLGIALILVAVVATAFRVRWRLIRSASLTAIRCPRCSGPIHRVHRRWGDRVLSGFVPVRRYRCSNGKCRWCGIRVAASKHGPDPTAPAS
jgi:hypothetical protein